MLVLTKVELDVKAEERCAHLDFNGVDMTALSNPNAVVAVASSTFKVMRWFSAERPVSE